MNQFIHLHSFADTRNLRYLKSIIRILRVIFACEFSMKYSECFLECVFTYSCKYVAAFMSVKPNYKFSLVTQRQAGSLASKLA